VEHWNNAVLHDQMPHHPSVKASAEDLGFHLPNPLSHVDQKQLAKPILPHRLHEGLIFNQLKATFFN